MGNQTEKPRAEATKLDAALDLAARGYAVFPLIPDGKAPAIDGWPTLATNDADQIRAWWEARPDCNPGIYTGELLVVDVDPRNGGEATFEALELTEDFPATAMSRTQGGGTHRIYALPRHTVVRGGNNRLGRGIDVKSYGGYVVAPGSTVDGRPYHWLNATPPAEAPQWLIDRCKTPATRSRAAGQRVIEEDETALDLAEQYLNTFAPEAVHGEIDDTAYRVAARLYDFGVSYETARALLAEWSDRKAHPPMEPDDIERVARSAQRNRGSAIGAKHPGAPGFDAYAVSEIRPPVAGATPNPGKLLLQPVTPFDPAALPLRPWVIPTLACRGRVTMLAGPGGVAKSTFTLMVAVAVVTGRSDICGFDIPARQAVGVFNQEDDLEEMQRRLAAVMQAYDVKWDDLTDAEGQPMLHISSGVDSPLMIAKRTDTGGVVAGDQVRQAVDTVRALGVRLLVLDPLSEMHEAPENDNVLMRAVVAKARDIAVAGDCSVLLVTHTKKPPQASSDGFAGEMDAARGASSQSGVIRVGETLFSASPKDAKEWRMAGSHLEYVRLDNAKNNLAARRKEPIWFKHESVAVGGFGGESVGILRRVELKRKTLRASNSLADALAAAIATHLTEGEWHRAGDVLAVVDPDSAGDLLDQKNRARALKDIFDGADEIPTNHGKLSRHVKSGRDGVLLKLNASECLNSDEALGLLG